ncbi:MAG TPA: alpha/beta fold hydrolase [Puia sp.]|nr:alpha/beta fold hydrolase [Puia sp.]
MKKKIFRWAKVFILVYCTGGIVLYYGQNSMLFHPVTVDKHTRYEFGQAYTEVNLPYDRETNLNIIQFRTPDSVAKGVVLYFHGNRANISRYASFAPSFTGRGYEVWMIDYPGFGKSTGKFTEQKLYDYALQLYKLARSRYKPSGIILYGKSLGTCMATQLANARDCRRLILETPCYSMTSLIRHWLPIYPIGTMLHYRFPNNEWLPGVTAPVSIFHGTSDGVIPYSNAARLKPLLKPGDEFITIEGGSHNDLYSFPLFRQKLDSLLER